jgi:glycosyltransferase involved in cell wall biosynthesis
LAEDGAAAAWRPEHSVTVLALKRVLRRSLLRGPRWGFATSYARGLWRRIGGPRREPEYDLVFLVHSGWESWILTGICKEIERHSGLRCTYHAWPGAELPPPARAYFVSHYSLFPLLLREDPAFWTACSLVWYTHPDDHGVDDASMFWALRRASRVVAPCTAFRELLVDRGVSPEQAACVLGGADPALFPRHERGDGAVGFSTAFYARKAPDRVLEIVRAMPHRRFLMLGRNWSRYARWEELRALPNFEYVEVPYSEYPGYYQRMDVFVSPAVLEGGPIPVLEAMMSNAVPVASRTGFAPDLVRHGENGFLFDVDATTAEICGLIEQAFELRADVRETVRGYSWEAFTRELLALLPADTFPREASSRVAEPGVPSAAGRGGLRVWESAANRGRSG